MFISNISQNQSTVFKQSVCIEKMFPSRKNLIRYMNDVPGFADALGVQMPKSTAEEKTVYDIFVQKVHEMMLALDARALKPIIKLPDPCNKKEKAAIIEYLEHRQLIDRLAEWASQRGKIITDGVNSDSIKAIKKLDEKMARVDMTYFNELGYLTDLCCPEENVREPLITDELRALYWDYLNQGNINKDGNLTAKQLLDLVKKTEEAPVQAQKKALPAARNAQQEVASAEKRLATKTNNSNTTTSKPKILNPKQLKSIIPLEYGKLLCKNIDFYRIMADNSKLFNKLIFRIPVTTLDYEKKRAHDIIWEKYSDSIDRCDHKSIVALEKDMGDKFNQYYRFKNLVTNKVPEMNNVGGMWNYMEGKEGILEMRRYVAEIKELRTKLQDDPHNQSLLQNIARRDILLEQDKDIWVDCLKKSIEGEKENYDKCVKNKCATEYTYLTSESVSLNGYKKLYEICEANEGELPEEILDRILTYAGEDGKLSEEAWAKILE